MDLLTLARKLDLPDDVPGKPPHLDVRRGGIAIQRRYDGPLMLCFACDSGDASRKMRFDNLILREEDDTITFSGTFTGSVEYELPRPDLRLLMQPHVWPTTVAPMLRKFLLGEIGTLRYKTAKAA